jgi:hypothetical protein
VGFIVYFLVSLASNTHAFKKFNSVKKV